MNRVIGFVFVSEMLIFLGTKSWDEFIKADIGLAIILGFVYFLYRALSRIGKWAKQKPENTAPNEYPLTQELDNKILKEYKPSLIARFGIKKILFGCLLFIISSVFIYSPT